MSGVSELWSLPWHALQRSLANRFGGLTPDAPGAARNASWMGRARARAGRRAPACA